MTKQNPEPSSLEKAVMEKLLEGDEPALKVLREQWRNSRVLNRKLTGVGFYHGAGFVLFVDDGVISFLEGFTYDEPWPEDAGSFELWYLKGSPSSVKDTHRDLEKLRAALGE
jgi:hypothetical protein